MSKDIEFTDTIRRVERRKSSRLGNPAWLVYFENHEPLPTQADTSWSYEAGNPEWENAEVNVSATSNGRIRYCTFTQKES
jgi:hypothetical protein